MPKYHVLRNYSSKPDASLADFGLKVAGQMTGNANFPDPVVTPAQLTTAANNFNTAIAKRPDGGKTATLAKNAAREALIALLDELAFDVEQTAQNNPVIMSSSGYDLADTGPSPRAPVGTTSILAITNAVGVLSFTFTPADNLWAIEVQSSVAAGTWLHGETFTNPRDAQLTGLTPGTMYAFRARALGSGNQKSAWSDPVSHMAT